jgi:hypothetical protein
MRSCPGLENHELNEFKSGLTATMNESEISLKTRRPLHSIFESGCGHMQFKKRKRTNYRFEK